MTSWTLLVSPVLTASRACLTILMFFFRFICSYFFHIPFSNLYFTIPLNFGKSFIGITTRLWFRF